MKAESLKRLEHIFTSLPPEGVAIHGTNLARAKRIQKEGFKRQKFKYKLPSDNFTYYIVQPPLFSPDNLDRHWGKLLNSFSHAFYYASRAISWNKYELENTHGNETRTLVIFKPLKNYPFRLELDHYPIFDMESRDIPAQNVYGMLPFYHNTTDEALMRGTYRLLKRTGVIDSARPQPPQEV